MDNDIQSVIQMLELYGKGLSKMWHGIRWGAKSAKEGVDIAKLKMMQYKLKVHYASTGTNDTMKVRDLEELTGGNYGILNIPTEDKTELIEFYDRLKKLNVSFAELPDLNVGDGYTQIAYNPADAEKVKFAVQAAKIKNGDFTEMSFEDYVKSGGVDGEKLLTELANKGYNEEQITNQLSEFKEKMKDKDNYRTVSINSESLLLKETKENYFCRIPSKKECLKISKEDCLIIDRGKTIVTNLPLKETIVGYQCDNNYCLTDNEVQISVKDIVHNYNLVEKDTLNHIDKLKINHIDSFPSFFSGQDQENTSPAPTETIENILSLEKYKKFKTNDNYIPLNFSKENIVAETESKYLIEIPDDNLEQIDCFEISKENCFFDEKKDRLTAYLNKKEQSPIKQLNKSSNGKFKDVEKRNNVDLIKTFNEREKLNNTLPINSKDMKLSSGKSLSPKK